MPEKFVSWIIALVCAGGCAVGAPVRAAAPACTTIVNLASGAYSGSGATANLASNPANVRVEELLDLGLAASTNAVAVPQSELRGVPFALTNTGNGDEKFVLEGRIDGDVASLEGFALDGNGNGRFDPGSDFQLPAGAVTPQLGAGAGATLLALVRAGTSTQSGTLIVSAHAVTGTGAPGSTVNTAGNGCDAIVGASRAEGTASVALTVGPGSNVDEIAMIKSQAVETPDGSANPVRGSMVTYSIETRFSGTGIARAARLTDSIPANTTYLPGSLRLDGAALTDSADADPGAFTGSAVDVALGDVPAPATRRIEFKVVIQ